MIKIVDTDGDVAYINSKYVLDIGVTSTGLHGRKLCVTLVGDKRSYFIDKNTQEAIVNTMNGSLRMDIL